MRSIALFLAMAFGSVAAAADPMTIVFELSAGDSVPTAGVELRATRVDAAAADRRATLPGAGGAIELEPGIWELRAAARGFWSEPVTARADETARIRLYPAARVRGEVSTPVRELTLYLAPSPAVGPSAIPTTSVPCTLRGKSWSCDVPAGTLDLAFRSPGFVSVYRWSQEAKRDATLNAGTLALRRGSSFTGTAAFAEKLPAGKTPPITVMLVPHVEAARPEEAAKRDALRTLTATPTARGFFHFTASPGEYDVQATAAGFISEEREVRVIEGKETQLRDPLLLERPRRFTLHVEPPIDPFRKRWIALLQKTSAAGVVTGSWNATVADDGTWTREGLTPGAYTISIGRSGNEWWMTESFPMAGDTTHDARIDPVHVLGSVTLGGKPLPSRIVFGGEHGAVRIPFRTRPDGTFHVILPAAPQDVWAEVDVTAEEPHVQRALRDVTVHAGSDGRARVAIELPSRMVNGEVIDERGAVQSHAIINVYTPAPEQGITQILSESGTFSAAGLPEGKIGFRAQTRDAETPQEVEVEAGDTNDPPYVRLMVRPRNSFRGIVQSAGGPVVGAAVAGMPLASKNYMVSRTPSDESGAVTVSLPADTRELMVSVAAPGFAWRLMRVAMQSDPPMPLFLDQQGGALTLEAADDRDDRRAFLLHGGAAIPAFFASFLADVSYTSTKPRRMTISSADPGVYSLCWLAPQEAPAVMLAATPPADRCTSGLLSPNGTLTLTAREPAAH